MEARKITIVSTTDSQTKKVIISSATTLGELKEDLSNAGISYSNMDFFEGVSKTKLINDESVLPANIPYKGATTNELVFMLTTSRKKIESGNARNDVYEEIRRHNLQDAIKEYFGKNFTQVTTKELEDFLTEVDATPLTKVAEVNQEKLEAIQEAFNELLEALWEEEFISDRVFYNIKSILRGDVVGNIDSSYDDDDIEEMFESMI